MDAVLILRQLWRLRGAVLATAALAVALGGLVAFRPGLPPQSRQYTVGVASARALIDTPSSQVVDLGLKQDANAGVLPARAVLLANLLATTPLKDATAREAHIDPRLLIAIADTPTDSGVPVGQPLTTGATVKPTDPHASVVTAHTDVDLPLLTINARAPDPRGAARLADAAITVLEAHLSSVVADAAVPLDRRIVVTRLGRATAGTQQHGPSPVLGVVAALVLFVFGCATIVVVTTLARDWRIAAGGPAAALPAPPAPDPDVPASSERSLRAVPAADIHGVHPPPERAVRWDG